MPVDIGFSLFGQQSEKPISTQYSRFGYIGMNEKVSTSFPIQSTSSDYKIYPTVAFCGIEMIAEPKAELEEDPIIGVWECVSISNIYGLDDDGIQKGDYLYFNADNTYSTSGGYYETGFWSRSGNQLTVSNKSVDSVTYTITQLDSSSLTFKYSNIASASFKRVK